APCSAGRGQRAPRHPSTGSANFSTSRSVNGLGRSRPTRTGSSPRCTVTTAPGPTSNTRRPSQHTTAEVVYGSTVTRIVDVGAVTSARLNSACALIGTSSSASTSGHTTGPPAENAYAVEPVGVAQTTPSHPYRDSRRPSTTTSS